MAGIVPHHLVAGDAIGSFFMQLAKQKPKTIILIGPNHFHVGNVGDAPFITGNQTITTHDAPIKIETSMLTRLKKSLNASLDIEPAWVANDHGITNLTPFIHTLLPHTTIVPIMISAGAPRETLARLINALAPIISEKTPLILSSDFSHYLSRKKALQKDAITESLIQAGNAERILELNNNDFLDTPEGLFVLMRTLAAATRKTTQKLLYHNDATTTLGSRNVYEPTTTYLIYTFSKE